MMKAEVTHSFPVSGSGVSGFANANFPDFELSFRFPKSGFKMNFPSFEFNARF